MATSLQGYRGYDADLIPLQSGEDWVAQLDDDLSRPAPQSSEMFSITTLQLEDPTCVTLLEWVRSDTFHPWTEVKSLCPELRFLWHHKNNLSADTNGFCGGNGVQKYLNYSYWYQNQDVNSCFGLSRLTDWRSSRPESYLSPIESAVLLVGHG